MNKLTLSIAVLFGLVNADTHMSSKIQPGPFVNETWYSGLVDIDASDDIFYWWFESRNAPDTDPLVLWLTGGPGCASEVALFFENGPYMFGADKKTLNGNAFSWNNKANLLYVDQPVGTGFSHAGILHAKDQYGRPVVNEDEVAENMATFLIKFIEKYPKFEGRDFFITGESYAGHYIPAISHNFIFKNKDKLKLNFKGMAIGNGLVSPLIQYPEYNTFALENNLITKAESLILRGGFKVCQSLIKTGVWPVALEFCQLLVTSILGLPVAPNFNVYDIR